MPPFRALRHPLALWAAFVLAHAWLCWLALTQPGAPLGDVTGVYRFWVDHGLRTGVWVGLDTVWVYPLLALVPMLLAWVAGPENYAAVWLWLVLALDLAALLVILGPSRRPEPARLAAGWWWTAFLVALGPIAVGRIDSVTVPIALAGLLLAVRHAYAAGILLAVAAWIKVWPAALGVAAAIALRGRARREIVTAAVAVCLAVAGVSLVLGGGGALFSFVTQQTGRGLQVESPVATPWLWAARLGLGPEVYYDTGILTYQVRGAGTEAWSSVMTPLMVVAVAGVLALLVVGVRRGLRAEELIAPVALALTTALIVFNKVGSPQFISWLAVPLVAAAALSAGAAGGLRGLRVPLVLGILLALLTQAFYPVAYGRLISLELPALLALTLRNVLELVLLAWAIAALARLVRGARPIPHLAAHAAPVPPEGTAP
ncbi:glycosyltransferase 87 family protein [Homoserinibacter sp. YIM 151385]|uniref:glycosyltransferase 87 family protein n=1 Tax=Homoserinibacter sp. YIM 151385 TaxID=2985506 RepID=UPI0022F059BB|nr:glycosyltransferase 87 family protein [Homoserinibacter sp. YIM 151385]WBU38238.1 glycosyltransferase 87 family protein [Homoserinibacter sp. YIM 151385]